MRRWVLVAFVLLAACMLTSTACADASPAGRTYEVQHLAFVAVTETMFVEVVVDGQIVLVPVTVRRLVTEERISLWKFRNNGRLVGVAERPLRYHSSSGLLFAFWKALDISDIGWTFYYGLTYFHDGATLKGKVILISPEFGIQMGNIRGRAVIR